MADTVEVTVNCPKELNDVRTAIIGIVTDIKAGKALVVIAGENLQALSDAIAGIDAIPDELKENLPESVACLGVLASELVSVLAKPKA